MYKLSSHSCYNINYHIVFCPKRRKKILFGDIVEHLEQKIREICTKNNIIVENITIMPDHVHLFISANPILAPHKIVKLIKGYTSNYLRKTFTETRKLPCLWSSSYYIGTVGFASESVVKTYIEAQKGK